MECDYETYASQVSPQSKLDQMLDAMHMGVEKHLIKIARDLDKLELLTIELGLKARDLKDITRNHSHDIRRQRSELLREWKRKEGMRATYKALLKACVKLSLDDPANTIVKLLQDDAEAVPCLFEDYAGRVNPRDKLEQPLDHAHRGVEMHLTAIARELEHLDEVVTALGYRQAVLRDIESAHPGELLSQKCTSLLRRWKRDNGGRATYNALLMACLDTRNTDAAEILVSLLEKEAAGSQVRSSSPMKSLSSTLPADIKQRSPRLSELVFMKKRGEKYRLLNNLAAEWREIATALGLEAYKIDLIQHQQDNFTRIQKVFTDWLQQGSTLPNSKLFPCTWEGLENLIKTVSVQEAEDFFEYLKK